MPDTAPTYQAHTVGQAVDVLTAVLREIDAAVKGQFPGDPKTQKAAKDAGLAVSVDVDVAQLHDLASSLPISEE